MKSIVIVWMTLLFIGWGSAQACEIEQARKYELGASEGIEGKCSNNGDEIR
jgi:hypothetical protein